MENGDRELLRRIASQQESMAQELSSHGKAMQDHRKELQHLSTVVTDTRIAVARLEARDEAQEFQIRDAREEARRAGRRQGGTVGGVAGAGSGALFATLMDWFLKKIGAS